MTFMNSPFGLFGLFHCCLNFSFGVWMVWGWGDTMELFALCRKLDEYSTRVPLTQTRPSGIPCHTTGFMNFVIAFRSKGDNGLNNVSKKEDNSSLACPRTLWQGLWSSSSSSLDEKDPLRNTGLNKKNIFWKVVSSSRPFSCRGIGVMCRVSLDRSFRSHVRAESRDRKLAEPNLAPRER